MNVVKVHFPLIKNILLMTTDSKVINDTKYYPDYNFYKTEYPLYNEFVFALIKKGVVDGYEEMMNYLINFYLAVNSAGMVCTLTSNFPRALIRFQYGAYNHINPVYSLDQWRLDIIEHSFPEEELGKFVHQISPKNYSN
jgi:hypothetical protein